ncbi:MAG: hypothetical protein KA210_03415 [Bacteroidia bacterium]|jgi:hypothetical protein|uniref:Uncharacterized protein n=1 Tax=Flavobacterium dankookense TaxID=706186 RepID=A0A4R6QGW1_9FLAO|nr:hypothetical protein [Flavobacterium dankookense]MBP6755173.1 hypothetical protein [Bacteroidia bacterium]MBP7859818.1 hypothetical protein [Patescibacteria group bacterium]TDP61213.1 hypothetical protein BC748_0827 [Flavobacterium dankookense]
MNFDYQEIEKRKFVKKFKLEELGLSNIKNLVLHNVFIEDEILIDNLKTDSIEFDTMITSGAKEYHINQDILKEIYTSIRFFVEVVATDTQFDLNRILTNLEGRIESVEKIKYLEKKHKDLYSQVKNEPEYLVYAEIKEFNGFENWEELVIESLNGEVAFIQKYLTSDIEMSDVPKEILSIWVKYYTIKAQIDFCKEQINKLKNTKQKSGFVDTSLQIFLLEEIINIKDWSSISATKKGEILSHLLGKNKDNIKKIYLELDKKISENSEKLLSDRKQADEFIKKLLG